MNRVNKSSDEVVRDGFKMTDIVDKDLSPAAGRWRASVAATPSTISAASKATSRRSAFVASAGWGWSGKARFGLAVLLRLLLVLRDLMKPLKERLKHQCLERIGSAVGTLPLERKRVYP